MSMIICLSFSFSVLAYGDRTFAFTANCFGFGQPPRAGMGSRGRAAASAFPGAVLIPQSPELRRFPNQPHRRTESFALYLRYQTTHHRAYYRALKQLLSLQKERAKSGTKLLVRFPKPTSDNLMLTQIIAEPQPALSGAGSPDPRRSPRSSTHSKVPALINQHHFVFAKPG